MSINKCYHRRLEKGLCPTCGSEREDEKFKMCAKCRAFERVRYTVKKDSRTDEEKKAFNEKRRIIQKERYRMLRSQGKCARCAGPSPDHWLCEECTIKAREQQQRRQFEADMLREAMEEEHW